MQRVSSFSIRGKVIADLLILTLISIAVQSNLFNDKALSFSDTNLVVLLTSLFLWFISGRAMGLYVDFRLKPFSIEWIAFLKALVLYTLLSSFFSFQLMKYNPIGHWDLLLHSCLIFVLLPAQKLAIRIALKRFRDSESVKRKVLIVGAGDTGMNFYQQYVKNEKYGYTLTGFIDDIKNSSLNGHYLGKTSELNKVIASHELDDIIVALPITQEAQIQNIVTVGEKEGKRIRIIPDYQRFGSGKFKVDRLGSLPIITLRSLPLDVVDNKVYKRLFDIVFSILVITLVFSWLFPIIALLIKISSKGSVFFKQERWGLNNKVITCYKFRSMVSASKDVDENGKYQQASKNDPRITPIGKFLRKSNLDELPQFLNVLLGTMSVVGPRPHPVPLNIASKDSIENYMMRHWVKPGITGWAQVSGYRGETRVPHLMQKRVEHDVWYMENWTFWLDLQIIVQTLVNMVKGEKNAF
ncbi:undecaprenyl-phosphate glucose phosphotransferase [Flavisolibacter tropicus]|uniref:undecaprenyl-phosphate glucose phosphotransferase n=1 Tax=Flavisolibacter tropicus TaxID=1492898 RepID=UPI0008365513|nr:undecaprenyl-phosphate glucose phosphotransferase [Flavisolibacter tropicus]